MADRCLHAWKYFVSLDLFRSTPKCPVLLVYVAVLAYAECSKNCLIKSALDLAVLFTPSTPNRQNRNQVRWNICAGVRQSTPSFEVVQTDQSRDLFQKRWRIIACMCGNILYRLIYSGVLQSAQFYLFLSLFWRTLSTLKIAKSSPPLVSQNKLAAFVKAINKSAQNETRNIFQKDIRLQFNCR